MPKIWYYNKKRLNKNNKIYLCLIFFYYNNIFLALLENTFSNGNREEKKKEYEKLQKLIVKDLPYISLFFKNKAIIVDGKVKGDIDPTFYDIYRNIEKWYIPKDFQ